jgi:hypothetical protein
MERLQKYTLLMLIFIITMDIAQATDIIRYNLSKKHFDPKQDYYIDLLKLILDNSKDRFGDYQLLPVVIEMPQGRTSLMVQQGDKIDVTWRMTSIELEQRLQAIYVPVLKGLMGHRIAIIRRDDDVFFSPSMTLEQLQSIPAGQGHDWPDSDILRFNGFDVVEGSAFTLLTMLEKRRFDYFPRALHEPWTELEGKTALTLEQYFLLKYPAPMYYFVRKGNDKLHLRLKYGFERILETGLFEQFFYQHPITQGILTKANLSQRKVFLLENPLLSKATKALLKNDALWLNLDH